MAESGRKSDASSSPRAIAYVDGFNLYYGLRDRGWKRYYWLDIWLLAANLLPNYRIQAVKYFTTNVKDNPDKVRRQQTFLRALRSRRPDLQIMTGKFLFKNVQCRECGRVYRIPEEKKTDVNIATEMVADGLQDRFDTALLISGDSDLVPPIEMIQKEATEKRVIVAFPPRRFSRELKEKANRYAHINEQTIRTSLLPNPVVKANKQELWKPTNWA